MRVRYGVWYDGEKVYVVVDAEIRDQQELERVERLIPKAHRKAIEWIESHGITGTVLEYRIRGGKVNEPPISKSVKSD